MTADDLPLAHCAAIKAAVAEGFALEEALATEGLSPDTFTLADTTWNTELPTNPNPLATYATALAHAVEPLWARPGAKEGDKIVLVPSPTGPVPTPMPMPFVGSIAEQVAGSVFALQSDARGSGGFIFEGAFQSGECVQGKHDGVFREQARGPAGTVFVGG